MLFEILEINKQNCATHTERDRHDKYVDTHSFSLHKIHTSLENSLCYNSIWLSPHIELKQRNKTKSTKKGYPFKNSKSLRNRHFQFKMEEFLAKNAPSRYKTSFQHRRPWKVPLLCEPEFSAGFLRSSFKVPLLLCFHALVMKSIAETEWNTFNECWYEFGSENKY